MPKGPQGQKRPADVTGAAVKVMRIATGEEPEGQGEAPPPSPAAQLGNAGQRCSGEEANGEAAHGD